MKKPPLTIITLVHGTWAQRAAWTAEDSALRRALEHGIHGNVEFRTFSWSGRNTMRGREEAAARLLESSQHSDPSAKRVVIAHSHGGNVAVSAYAQDATAFDGVITLNAPFLSFVPRSTQISLLFFLLVLLAVLHFISTFFHYGKALEMAAGAIVVAATLALIYAKRDRMLAPLVSAVGTQIRPADRHHKLLCLSTLDDEAFAGLEMVDAVLNVPYLVLHVLVFPLTLIAIFAAHIAFRWDFSHSVVEDLYHMFASIDQGQGVGTMIWSELFSIRDITFTDEQRHGISQEFYEHSWSFADTAFFVLQSSISYFLTFWGAVAVGSVATAYLVRAMTFGSGAGLDALILAYGTRLKVSLTPPAIRGVELRFVPTQPVDSLGGFVKLRHSDIYANEFVFDMVGEWINALPAWKRQQKTGV